MKTQKIKLKNAIVSHKEYLIVFGAIFVLFNLMLILNGAYPYGTNTVLISDSYAQIGPFFEQIFTIFEGKSTCVYTNAFVGGTEILSTILYMLLNPFYILALPFGKTNIMNGFSLVLFAILVFDAFIFLWFSKKYFKNIKVYTRILLALIFTFSGYMMLNYGFFTWLIYPAITLLLIDAFLKLVNEKKIANFVAVLVWFVANSFGVGFSSNFMLILLMCGYILIMLPKPERKSAFLRLFFGYILAVLFSLIILAPSLFAMMDSSRNSNVIANIFSKSDYNKIENKIAGVFLETAVAVFGVVYLARCDKKDKKNIFYFFALAIVFAPIVFDVCQKIMCGSIYLGFPFRFEFLACDLLFVLAMEFLERKELELSSETDCLKEQSKSNFIFKFLISFVLVLFVIGLIFFDIFMGEEASKLVKYPGTISSTSLFYFLITLLFVAVIALTLLFKWRNVISAKFMKIAMTFTLSIALMFNFCTFALSAHTSTDKLNEATTLVSSNSSQGNLKFILLDSDAMVDNTTLYGVCNNDYFSSLISEKTINSFSSLGFRSGTTFVSSQGGTLVADSLIGANLYLSSQELNRPYLSLIKKSENFYLYKNTLATTGAVVLPKSFMMNKSLNSFKNIQTLAENFEISGELFKKAGVVLEGEPVWHKALKSFSQQIVYTASNDQILYVNAQVFYDPDDDVPKTEGIVSGKYYLSQIGTVDASDLIFVNAGETVRLNIYYEKEDDLEDVEFVSMDYNLASTLCTKLKENEASLEKTKLGFIAKGSGDGNLFVSSPMINGLEFSLNGKKINGSDIFSDWTCIEVNGNFEVTAEYHYPHITAWIIIVVICLVLIVTLGLVYKFVNLQRFEKPASVIMLVVCGIDFIVCYATGIVLSLLFIILCIIKV